MTLSLFRKAAIAILTNGLLSPRESSVRCLRIWEWTYGFLFLFSVQTAFAGTAPITATPEQVSHCFFVYAPIMEVAKRNGAKPLIDYALPRMSWMSGYFEAKQGDANFQQIFTEHGAENKAFGIALEHKLTPVVIAVREGRKDAVVTLQSVLTPARECDVYIGMASH